MRRLVWARVCRGCAKRLSGPVARAESEGAAASPSVAASAPDRAACRSRRADAWDAGVVVAGLVTLAIVARHGGASLQEGAAGGLVAELLVWSIATSIDAPFAAARLAIGILARTVLLGVLIGPELVGGLMVVSPYCAVGFGAVLLARVAMIAIRRPFDDDDRGDREAFERSLPFR